MTKQLRDLDDKVLGRTVPDDRPLAERVLRPRPAVSSSKGRLLYGGVLLAGLAVAGWVSDPLVGGLTVPALVALAGSVIASEEGRRSRGFHGDGDR